MTENNYFTLLVWVITTNNNSGLRQGLVGLGFKAHLKGPSLDSPFCFEIGKAVNL
jgi:hypothetical protein